MTSNTNTRTNTRKPRASTNTNNPAAPVANAATTAAIAGAATAAIGSRDNYVAQFVAATRTNPAGNPDVIREALRTAYRAMSDSDAVATRAAAMAAAFTTADADHAAVMALDDYASAPVANTRTRSTRPVVNPLHAPAMAACALRVALETFTRDMSTDHALYAAALYAGDENPAVTAHAARILNTLNRAAATGATGPKTVRRITGRGRGAGKRHVAYVAALYPAGTRITSRVIALHASPDYPAGDLSDASMFVNAAGDVVMAPAPDDTYHPCARNGASDGAVADVIRTRGTNGAPAVTNTGDGWRGDTSDGNAIIVT